jgi:hypothetical protein
MVRARAEVPKMAWKPREEKEFFITRSLLRVDIHKYVSGT